MNYVYRLRRDFLGHYASAPVPQPKRHLDRFSRLRRVPLYFTMGRPFFPQNCPFPVSIWIPFPSNTWFAGSTPVSAIQTASGSVQPFLQDSLVWQTTLLIIIIIRKFITRTCSQALSMNRRRGNMIQYGRSVRIGLIYVRSTTAMRHNNNDW